MYLISTQSSRFQKINAPEKFGAREKKTRLLPIKFSQVHRTAVLFISFGVEVTLLFMITAFYQSGNTKTSRTAVKRPEMAGGFAGTVRVRPLARRGCRGHGKGGGRVGATAAGRAIVTPPRVPPRRSGIIQKHSNAAAITSK